MSQLRAPAARAERREGGRHGRPHGPRPPVATGGANPAAAPDFRIRSRLLRTAVLPATVAALSGATAVILVLRASAAEPSGRTWAALGGTALMAFAAIATAALGAERTARSVLGRCNALRRATARRQADLDAVVERLRRGERVPEPRTPPSSAEAHADEFDHLAHELGRSHEAAVGTVVQAYRLSSSVGDEQKVEVFVNLARRLQSLVHREIQLLDELENEVEDPELLKGLFHVDHLATRIRRHAENLAVLGGAVSRRQWSRPVSMTEVLRSAVAEVEQYPRVRLVPPVDGALRGHAVADVIHLLAELVENATLFSSPHTQVLLRAQHVTAGLAVEVEDRGLGMPPAEQQKMNDLLADPDQVNVARLLQDGRIGLFVVAALARRHGIAVRLQSNIYGGIQAVLVLPPGLLGSDRADGTDAAGHAGRPDHGHRPDHGLRTDHAERPEQAGERGGGGRSEAAPVPATTTAPAPWAVPPPAPAPSTIPVPVPVPVTPHVPAPVTGTGRATSPTAPLPVPRQAPPRPSHAPVAPARLPQGAPPGPDVDAPGSDGVPAARPGRPPLPRRRGQEHLVPQLRGGPVPPTVRGQEHVLHNPGLMAAFRRGIGLAESRSESGAGPEPGGRSPSPSISESAPGEATSTSTYTCASDSESASESARAYGFRPAAGHTARALDAPAPALPQPLPEPPEPQRHPTTPKE
ncbi:sensor histidine kinase [Streptomyces hebeiensis]|uniref:sensor histidine kinase n=1 Tax=Streptomyces hebeiensis TaxID=229486 RepID=UPI0031D322E1